MRLLPNIDIGRIVLSGPWGSKTMSSFPRVQHRPARLTDDVLAYEQQDRAYILKPDNFLA